jgi:hypothetical protein
MILIDASWIAKALLVAIGAGLLIGVVWCIAAYFTFHPLW